MATDSEARAVNEVEDRYLRRQGPIHLWFGLSYSNYLVLPRTILMDLPTRVQQRLIDLIEDIHRLTVTDKTRYLVYCEADGIDHDNTVAPWADYRHPTHTDLLNAEEATTDNPDNAALADKGKKILAVISDALGANSEPAKDMASILFALRDLERQVRGYQSECREVEQVLGKALGYPWLKDDPKNFPDATEEDGVCVGAHVAGTIAAEAADTLRDLSVEVDRLRQDLANAIELVDRRSPIDCAAEIIEARGEADLRQSLLEARPELQSIEGETEEGVPAHAEWVDAGDYLEWDMKVDAAGIGRATDGR